MDAIKFCQSYFNGLQELFGENSQKRDRLIGGLKILSYLTLLAPLGVGVIYGVASLRNRLISPVLPGKLPNAGSVHSVASQALGVASKSTTPSADNIATQTIGVTNESATRPMDANSLKAHALSLQLANIIGDKENPNDNEIWQLNGYFRNSPHVFSNLQNALNAYGATSDLNASFDVTRSEGQGSTTQPRDVLATFRSALDRKEYGGVWQTMKAIEDDPEANEKAKTLLLFMREEVIPFIQQVLQENPPQE